MINEWKDITDPEELFRLKREGWEIQRLNTIMPDLWSDWDGCAWVSSWALRGRPRQPKIKKVKLFAYLTNGRLEYLDGQIIPYSKDHIRQPHLDLEGEVPE